MTRKLGAIETSTQLVLLVDDDPAYLAATERLLVRAGYRILIAGDPHEGLEIVRRNPVELILLDYRMPGMTGEAFLKELREFNDTVQVILQTGYSEEHPPREMLRRLNIQGYHDKSEGPDKLLLWTDVGLKAARTVRQLEQSRQGLRYILSVTPEMHRPQPLSELLQGILLQTAGLLGVVDSFVAVLKAPPKLDDASDAFVAMVQSGTELVIRAGTGRFSPGERLERSVSGELLAEIRGVLESCKPRPIHGGVAVPLQVGSLVLGVIYLDQPLASLPDAELVQLFANQASVAIHNAQLFEMAAFDTLTKAYTRRFFEHAVLREVRSALRSRHPVTLLLVDLDEFKAINDTAGHLVGDRVLAEVAGLLRNATRAADVIGRYGGDEFVVLLPATGSEGARVVVARILGGLRDLIITEHGSTVPVSASLGLATLQAPTTDPVIAPRALPLAYFQTLCVSLFARADASLYDAKRAGRARCGGTILLDWPDPGEGTTPLAFGIAFFASLSTPPRA